MPSYQWSNPGFDFIYRSWNVVADADVAEFTLQVSDGLDHPLFVVHEFGSEQLSIDLDGAPLVSDVDYLVSYDADGRRLWISLQQRLAAGSHQFEVRPGGGDPLPSVVTSASATSTGSASTGAATDSSSTTSGAGGGTTTGSGGATASITSETSTSAAAPTPEADAEDGGCACRAQPVGESKGPPWPLLALGAAFGAIRRRMSRAPNPVSC
jgi:MYXO-CTERM domain-containing protein